MSLKLITKTKKIKLLFDKLSAYQLFKEYPSPWSKEVVLLECL